MLVVVEKLLALNKGIIENDTQQDEQDSQQQDELERDSQLMQHLYKENTEKLYWKTLLVEV